MNFILTAYPYLNPSPSPSPSPNAYPYPNQVGCIDMNLVVALDTVRARDDWNAFDARVTSERAACPRVALTEPQLETLRRSVSEAAVCGASPSPPSSPGDEAASSGDGATAGAVAGGVIGGLVAFSMLAAGLVYLCRQKSLANNRASNANAQAAARAASSTTGQGQQMSNMQPPVVQGSLYPPTYAMGTPVV